MTATLTPASGRFRRIRENKTQTCEICGQPTNARKPYCIDHIEHLDYIKELMEKIAKEDTD